MTIYRKEFFTTTPNNTRTAPNLPSFLTKILDQSIGRYLDKYQTADSRYTDRILSYPNPDELPDQEDAHKPKFAPKRTRKDINLFGLIPNKRKKYGSLTLLGRLRIQIGSMKRFFTEGTLSIRNGRIINNKPNNTYLQAIVERINRKLNKLDDRTIREIIDDSTKKMSPKEETAKGYRR